MGNVCNSKGGTKRHLIKSLTEELDNKVQFFMNKEKLREETLKKSSYQHTFEELFGETTTSWGNIRKIYMIEKDKIGRGHFGQVKKASLFSRPGKVYALKEISKEKCKNDMHLLKRELDIMRTLDHPNIIKFYEAYQDMKSFYITMELCSGGELVKLVSDHKNLKEEDVRPLMKQIFSSVIHLHDRGIAHRDLKPDNFLFDTKDPATRELRLIDFGLSTRMEPGKMMKSTLGTPYYVAPDVLKRSYDCKCDLWSCGVIMYLLLSGQFPFTDIHHDQQVIFNKILKGKYTMSSPIWKKVSKEAKHLLKLLLEVDPSKRVNARVALCHPWFEGLNAADKLQLKPNVTAKTINLLKNFKVNKTQMQQEVIKIVVNMLNPSEYAKLKCAFKYIDRDHSGFLTVEDILCVMKELGYNDSETEIKEMISNVSMKDEFIGYTEFIAATLERKVYMDRDNLWGAFKFFDIDNSGIITSDNIKECFARFGKKVSDNDVAELIKEVDVKGDKRINWDEFEMLMNISNLENPSSSLIEANLIRKSPPQEGAPKELEGIIEKQLNGTH